MIHLNNNYVLSFALKIFNIQFIHLILMGNN